MGCGMCRILEYSRQGKAMPAHAIHEPRQLIEDLIGEIERQQELIWQLQSELGEQQAQAQGSLI